jgi:hypothetical protein
MNRSFDTKLQNTRRTLLRVTLGTLGAVSFLGMRTERESSKGLKIGGRLSKFAEGKRALRQLPQFRTA